MRLCGVDLFLIEQIYSFSIKNKMKNKYEIIVFGRGGQGAKSTAELLAQAAVIEGNFVQAFPEFGPERSGAPVKTFVRISKRPIYTHQPILKPDYFLVLDETLLNDKNIINELDLQNSALIINTKKGKNELVDLIGEKLSIYTIDASGISREIVGENRPNTCILGKFVFVSEIVKLRSITKVFEEKYLSKLGKLKTQKNIEAIEEACTMH
jgi:pyruvate ferredoxin oxidoreductase gamma subunit